MRAIFAISILAFACNGANGGDDDDGCPSNAPGFTGIDVTVTAGSSTSVLAYSNPWPPTITAGFLIDTGDYTIATISPKGGQWAPGSDAPMFTVTAANTGSDRSTEVYGAVLDCGNMPIGSVNVTAQP